MTTDERAAAQADHVRVMALVTDYREAWWRAQAVALRGGHGDDMAETARAADAAYNALSRAVRDLALAAHADDPAATPPDGTTQPDARPGPGFVHRASS